MDIFKEHSGFQEETFVNDVFGIDHYPKHVANYLCESKPGWLSWSDVREYFGLGSLAVNPQYLREGYMSDKLYKALSHKIGQERLDRYFGGNVSASKVSQEEKDCNDLAVLLCGTPQQINEMRSRRGNREFFK